ncbi:T9SS type A sorting domain-containing protein [Fluviicola sp.]|uniref:T9SS type A sorting domain-containing protein n=1 Tax=Fluviicola sp. TaxID=1917219 RepID=UPI003D2A584C
MSDFISVTTASNTRSIVTTNDNNTTWPGSGRSYTFTPIAFPVSQNQTNVSCFGGSNGSATVTPSGGTSPYTYSWAPSGGTGSTASGLIAGTYTCTITDAVSSSVTSTFTITQPPVLSVTAASQTNVSCFGGSNGAASINTPTGGAGGYTYNWTPGNPTGDGTVSVTGLSATTYTCTVTDANSCVASQNFTVTQPTAISVTPASQTNVSCFGGSNGAASINTPTGGAGGYTYNWTPGTPTGDGTVSVTGLAAGTWTCTVTDANGCVASQNFTVTQPTAISVTPASQTNVSCFGGSNGAASINTPTGGAGGYTYNWTPGTPTGDGTVSVTGLTATTWTCTVTDANGCVASQNFTVTQPTAISVTPASQTNVSCFGGSNGAASINTPTGGAGGYTYNWTPGTPTGDGTVSVTGLAAGTWTCTVTDANSCVASQNFTVTQPTAISVTPASQTNVSCFGGSNGAASINTPTGGAGGYTYNWTPGNPTGDGTVSVTGLSATTYTCTVTDANSCVASQNFTVTQPTAISVTPASQTNVSCFGGSNGAASINTPTGGAGGYTYNWTPGTPTGDGTVSVTGLTATTWTCTVTDANGCVASQNFTVTQPTAISVTPASQTNVSCFGGSNGAASINTPTGGAGGYTYNWTPGTPTGDGTVSVTGLAAGTWTCTVTDANSCVASQNFTVTQPTAISVTPASQTNVSCFGGSNGAASINTPTGGAGGYTYNWTPGNPTGDGTVSVTGLSATTYTCTVTDANGCVASQNFTVTQPTAISVTPASQTNVSCFGGSNGAASINTPTGGAGGYTYNWTPGTPTGDGTVSVTGLAAGTWTCTVTDANGCVASQNFTVTQPTAISVTPASQTNVSCFGGSNGAASINTPTGGAGGYTYNWTPGTPTGDGTVSVTGLTATTWTCTVTDANGCVASQNFTVTQPTAISVTPASQTNVSCFGGSNGAASINTPTGGAGGYTYNWTPGTPTGDGTVSVTGLTATTWTCTVTDANGCVASQNFTVTQPTAISVTPASQTNVSCFGGSNGAASINTPTGGAGGYTYNWTPGNPTGDGTVSVTGLSATTYTCTVTDANGCVASQNFTVTQPTAISVTPASQTNVSCFGGSNGAAAINTPTGGAGGYTYNWTPGTPTGDGTVSVTGLAAGTWTCTVTDANGCVASQSFTVTQPPVISVTPASQTNVSCFGGSNGAASINTPTGGAGGYTYNWTPGNPTGDGTVSVTGLSATTYTCTVTDANSCVASQSFTVTQPTAISVTAASQTNVACNGGSNGAAAINAPTGGTPGYTYDWTPGTPTGDGTVSVTGLSATTYTCTVTDANSCVASQSFTVTQPTAISVTAASQTNVACNGGSNGAAAINAPTGGTPGYTYDWTPGTPTGDGTTAITGLTAGTYTVTVTDANGCTANQAFTVTQPTAIAVTAASQTNVACNGGSNGAAAINTPTGGAGGYTYNWTPGTPTGDGTVSVTGLTATTWTCTVTDANGCVASQSFTVTQPPVISVTPASQTNVSCFGGSNGAASINTPTGGAGGYTYNWTAGTPTGDGTVSVTGLTATTYTCTVTDANGCVASQSFTVTQPTAISVTPASQTNVSCFGGSNGAASINTPTGGAGGYTYNWTPGNPTGDGTVSVTGLSATTYTCTVTDANSCVASQSFTVTQPTAISVTAASQTNVACNGGSNGAAAINAPTGGTPGYTYDWTPGTPTGDGTTAITGLTAGTYTVTVTDANGCTANQAFTITEPTAISVTPASQTNVACNGGSNGAAAINTPTGGTPGYTYDWTPGTPTGDGTTAITSLAAGTYTVTVTDANGCAANQAFTITEPTAISVTPASQTNVACNGGSNGAAAINTPTGGTPGYTYDWTPGTPTGDGTTAITGLTAGTYTVTVTDANGCAASQAFTITDPTAISVTAASQTNVACNGGSNGAAAINTPTGGTPGYTYDWTPGTPTGDGTTAITGLAAGTYTVTVTDANGCTANQAFTITEPTAISVTAASQTNVSCNGGSNGAAAINAPTGGTPGYTYDWTPGTPTGDGTTAITGLAAGTYTVTVTDANGCTANQAFTVTQPTAISVTPASQTNVACNGGSNGAAAINAPTGGTPGYTYNWTPGTPTGDGTTAITGLAAGTYTVTVTDANGCAANQAFTITEPTAISVTAASQTNVSCNGDSDGTASINTPTGGTPGYTYDWAPGTPTGDGTIAVTGLTLGTYIVTVTDANGCSADQIFAITEPAAITNSFTATDCDSYTWNAQTYNTSGAYTQVFTSASGCDSTVTLNLTINFSSSESLNVTECESYTLNGQTYTTSGTYTQLLTNSAGCDSTITLNLTINTADADTTVATACDSFLWNGQTFTTTGFYTLSFTNVNGCDSIENLDLTIISSPVAGITSLDVITLQATGTGTYQWINCSGQAIAGETNATFTATSNGSYAVIVSNGTCSDTSDCVVISHVGLDENKNSFGVALTPNPAQNDVKVTFTGVKEASIIIYDAQGKVVMTVNQVQSGEMLSLEAFERGVYLVNIMTTSGNHTERLVKQ